jgi:hypothetical protein
VRRTLAVSLKGAKMNKKLGLFILVLCIVLLIGCSSVNTKSVKHDLRLDHRGRGYEIGGSGEVLEYPIRGGSGTYEVVKRHFKSSERNFCVYSATFYKHTFFLYLVIIGGFREDFLTIVKCVEEDGGSFYVLVYDFCTGPGSLIMEQGIVKIEVDGSLYTFKADAVGSFHCYAISYRLTPDIVVKLENAEIIRIDYSKDSDNWITLDDNQRLILQSFLLDTESITYSAP